MLAQGSMRECNVLVLVTPSPCSVFFAVASNTVACPKRNSTCIHLLCVILANHVEHAWMFILYTAVLTLAAIATFILHMLITTANRKGGTRHTHRLTASSDALGRQLCTEVMVCDVTDQDLPCHVRAPRLYQRRKIVYNQHTHTTIGTCPGL